MTGTFNRVTKFKFLTIYYKVRAKAMVHSVTYTSHIILEGDGFLYFCLGIKIKRHMPKVVMCYVIRISKIKKEKN